MAQRYASQLRGYASHPERLRSDPTFPIFELGYTTGKNDVRDVVLSHLQHQFIDAPNRPERNTEQYNYLLGFAQELADLMRNIEPGAPVDHES